MKHPAGLILVLPVLTIASPNTAAAVTLQRPSVNDCVTCLGSPTSDLPYKPLPLGNFKRMPTSLQLQHKPEFLVLEGETNGQAAAERWPLVKALSQFGAFSDLRSIERKCLVLRGGTLNGATVCSAPTFDLPHAKYQSPYFNYVDKELIDDANTSHINRLSAAEKRAFVRYFPGWRDPLAHYQLFPVILAGNYIQVSSSIMTDGDLLGATTGDPVAFGLPFATIQQSLLQGRLQDSSGDIHLVRDVNAEANLLTGMICHMDGRQPRAVCGRKPIRQILKRVK